MKRSTYFRFLSVLGIIALGHLGTIDEASAQELRRGTTQVDSSGQMEVAQQFPPAEDLVPQDEVEFGRETRSGSSYIGIGGNFGAVGGSSIGKDGLIIYSKLGLTDFFSVRPAVTTNFSDDATFLLPLTFDFQPINVGKVGRSAVNLAPYVGGGMAVSTEGEFGPMVNGGIDIPLNSDFTTTAGLNAGFINDADFGIFVGVGYNIGR